MKKKRHMSKQRLSYEDFFRLPVSESGQNASPSAGEPLGRPSEWNLRQAASLLVGSAASVVKTALHSLQNKPDSADIMSEIRNQGMVYGERMHDEQGFQYGETSVGGRFGDELRVREPERFRPLDTAETYREPIRHFPDSRKPTWERGQYEHADNRRGDRWENERHFAESDRARHFQNDFEMQRDQTWQDENTGYDRRPFYEDVAERERETYFDRQPYYESDRQRYNESDRRSPDRLPSYRQQDYERRREVRSGHEEFVGDQYFRASHVNVSEQEKESSDDYNAPKQRTEQGDSGEQDDGDGDEEDTTYCKFCDVHFDSPQKYFTHTRGMLHAQRQMAGSISSEGQAEVREQNRQRSEEPSASQGPGPQQQVNETAGTDQGDHGQEEEEEDDDEDTSFCKLCNVSFDSDQKYLRHTRGLLHTQRQVEAKRAKLGLKAEDQQQQQEQPPLQPSGRQPLHFGKPQMGGIEDTREDEQYEDQFEEEWEEQFGEGRSHNGNAFICELCDIRTTGIQILRAHENGRNHKLVQEAVENGTVVPQRIYSKLGPNAKIPDCSKPITAAVLGMQSFEGPSVLMDVLKNVPEAVVGTAFVKEGRSGKQASFLCTICESMCDVAGIVSHLIGSKHRMKYLREHRPTVYEHVRNHGGKKSQLSAFLEQICSDVEKEVGRSKPMMNAGAGGGKEPEKAEAAKNEVEKASEEEEKKTGHEAPAQNKGKNDKRPRYKRCLPHDVVMAMYEEDRHRLDYLGPERPYGGRDEFFGPDAAHAGRGWGGPEEGGREEFFRPEGPYGGRDEFFGPDAAHAGRGWRGPEEVFRFGRGGGRPGPGVRPPRPEMGMDPGGRPGPGVRPPRPEMGMDPYYDLPRMPEPYPPYPEPYPEPFIMTEEERLHRMREYEAYLFNQPMLLVSPEEARHRMFAEYERLGIPYDIACDRVLIQESIRAQIMEYMNEGVSLKEAQTRIRRLESRKRLIREYEQQGLDPREARWRVIAEEERSKLYEKYEQLGFSPLEARTKIMNGEDRMHLIQEFERQGMTPEEAHKRAVNEENRLKEMDSVKPSAEGSLDDIADRRMLEGYIEQGDSKEQAENKMIAVLRRQGVPTQEAILRVQKIDVRVPEKPDRGPSPKSHDDHKRGREKEKKSDAGPPENFDNITPEEAKERLFQEYEKRGVPREKARLALIQELIRSGVPKEEAERRFSDVRPAQGASRERREKRKHTERSRSRSSSGSRRRKRSSSMDRKKSFKSGRDERIRSNVHDDRSRLSEQRKKEDKFPYRHEREFDRGARADKDGERNKESTSRPTLTLGEELKLKVRKMRRAELFRRLEEGSSAAKQAKVETSLRPAEKTEPRLKEDKSVTNLLESLTDDLISSKDNESVAMSMSKALTSALMKYRLSSSTDRKEEPSDKTAQSSFIERRIQDAKRLFETKMLPQKDTPTPSGSGTSRGGYGGSGSYGSQPSSGGDDKRDISRMVRPERFGLPPPVSSFAQSSNTSKSVSRFQPKSSPQRNPYAQSSSTSSLQSRFQGQTSPERRPIIPRVLLAQKNSAKGSSSSSRRLR